MKYARQLLRHSNTSNLFALSWCTILLLLTLPFLTTPLLSNIQGVLLTILLLVGLWWLNLIRRHGWQLLATSLSHSFLFLLVSLCLTALFSQDPSRSWRTVWQWSAFILIFYMALAFFRAPRQGKKAWPIFLGALLIIFTLFVAFGYVELIFWMRSQVGYISIDNWLSEIPRISGLVNNPNPFAELLVMALMLTLPLAWRAQGVRALLLWTWNIFAIGAVILTQSRGAWIALIVGVVFLIVGTAYKQQKRFRTVFTPQLFLFIISVGLIFAGLTFFLRGETFAGGQTQEVYYRTRFWSIALQTWQNQPILGVGPATYPTAYLLSVPVPFDNLYRSAHSIFFTVLSEMGLLGTAAIVWLVGQTTWLVYRQKEKWERWTIPLLASLFAFALNAQVNTPWLRAVFLAAILLAALVAPYDDPKQTSSRWLWAMPLVWISVWFVLVVTGWQGQRVNAYYERGITAVENQAWEEALVDFTQAEAIVAGRDSSILMTTAFVQGNLAFLDEHYLPSAIASYEELILLEPGWSVNHANLAALYWQSGEYERALDALALAIDRAPQVPVYHLNLGLWQEALRMTEAATASYAQLATLPNVWHEDPFWQRPLPARALQAVTTPTKQTDPGLNALLSGELLAARAHFTQLTQQSNLKTRARGWLGLGITAWWQGDQVAAQQAWERASQLPQSPADQVVLLWWQRQLPDYNKDEAEFLTLLDQVYHTAHYVDMDGGDNSNYMITLYGRYSLPFDFIPQVQCFTIPFHLGSHLTVMQMAYDNQLVSTAPLSSHLPASDLTACLDDFQIKP